MVPTTNHDGADPILPGILTILVVAVLSSSCVMQALTSGRVQVRDERATADAGFSSRDRSLVEDYYRKARSERKTPSGQVQHGLARHSVLPPGVQGRRLPRDLESRLTVIPATSARLVVGHDVVLIERDTRRVLDILYDVIPE